MKEEDIMNEAIEERAVVVDTGAESPQSISVVAYYKGYCVTITKRNSPAKKLIEDVEILIDQHMSQNPDWKPSWNSETNKAAVPQSEQWIDPPQSSDLGKCNKCGAPRVRSKPKADGSTTIYCSAKCWLK